MSWGGWRGGGRGTYVAVEVAQAAGARGAGLSLTLQGVAVPQADGVVGGAGEEGPRRKTGQRWLSHVRVGLTQRDDKTKPGCFCYWVSSLTTDQCLDV